MYHVSKLQTLNISGNIQMNLLDIRPVFQNLTDLQSLSIADITNMPLGIFVPLSNLQMLNISGTHLNNETIQILNPLAKLKVSFFFSFLTNSKSEYNIRTLFIIQSFFQLPRNFYMVHIFIYDMTQMSYFFKNLYIHKTLPKRT